MKPKFLIKAFWKRVKFDLRTTGGLKYPVFWWTIKMVRGSGPIRHFGYVKVVLTLWCPTTSKGFFQGEILIFEKKKAILPVAVTSLLYLCLTLFFRTCRVVWKTSAAREISSVSGSGCRRKVNTCVEDEGDLCLSTEIDR